MASFLTILVVDHIESDRAHLTRILSKFGHHVICVKNGEDAIRHCAPSEVDLVCLNPDTRSQRGWECVGSIENIANSHCIPILLLGDGGDLSMQTTCLLVGCLDLLTKPFTDAQVVLKINSTSRFIALQKVLESQRDEMASYSDKVFYDQHLAKVVYENITHSNCLKDSALSHFHYGSNTFNGDVILAAYKPSGGMHLVLGDFTGQGLSAAMGALPLADIFFDWTARGFLMKQIILEINDRLQRILPVNMFCSLAFVDIDPNNDAVEIWNGGVPDLLYFSKTERPKRFTSKNLPLGIVSSSEIDYQSDTVFFAPGDKLLIFSDGVYEATDLSGATFSETVLKPLYQGDVVTDSFTDWLAQQLEQEGVLDNPHDDISCIEIRLDLNVGVDVSRQDCHTSSFDAPADFSFEYMLHADSLRTTDPLPYLLQILTTVPGLSHLSSQIFMILSELYSNALEHGVLNLNSDKKSSPEGFSQYYEERKDRLTHLKSGYVKLSAKVVSGEHKRSLILTVEDSGKGFDYINVNDNLFNSELLHHRGLALLNRLCSKLEFTKGGSTVTAHYHW